MLCETGTHLCKGLLGNFHLLDLSGPGSLPKKKTFWKMFESGLINIAKNRFIFNVFHFKYPQIIQISSQKFSWWGSNKSGKNPCQKGTTEEWPRKGSTCYGWVAPVRACQIAAVPFVLFGGATAPGWYISRKFKFDYPRQAEPEHILCLGFWNKKGVRSSQSGQQRKSGCPFVSCREDLLEGQILRWTLIYYLPVRYLSK